MLSLKLIIIFLSVTSALGIRPRGDGPTLRNDLVGILGKTDTLTLAVNNYNGDFFSLGPVSTAEAAVEKAIEKATKTGLATPVQTDPESKLILKAAQDLVPNVVAALEALKEKKELFQSQPFVQQTVLKNLKKLRAGSADLTQAIIWVLTGDHSLDGPIWDVKGKIDTEFTTAIEVFST